MKESFVFHKMQYDAISGLSSAEKGLLFDAVCQYAFTGKVASTTNAVVYMAFSFIKQQIDLDKLKYEVVVNRNKTNGSKGGRPPKDTEPESEKPKKPSGLFGNPPINPKPKKADNDNDNDNDCVNDNDYLERDQPKPKGFVAPTLQEVEIYLSENNLSFVNPQVFIDFYSSKGWMVGKSKMKDWRAAARNWNAKGKEEQSRPRAGGARHPANELFPEVMKDQLSKF